MFECIYFYGKPIYPEERFITINGTEQWVRVYDISHLKLRIQTTQDVLEIPPVEYDESDESDLPPIECD